MWKNSGIAAQLNAKFLLLLNVNNTSRNECNIILSTTILVLRNFSFKRNHFGILFFRHQLAASRSSITDSGRRLTG